jgi:arsenate reductase-like glutaredoxin family protein
MIYSKRRKSVGDGRRKQSNRKSYRSKRTKRTTLTRIKQHGGSFTEYTFITTQLHKETLLKILNDNKCVFTPPTQNYTVDNLTYQIKNKSMTEDRINALITFLKEKYKPNNPSIHHEIDGTNIMFYVNGKNLDLGSGFKDTPFEDLSITELHERKISYTFLIKTGEETEFADYLKKNNITFTLKL